MNRNQRDAARTTRDLGTTAASPRFAHHGEALLTVEDLAAYTGLPIRTIYTFNHNGTGPTRIRLGKRVLYRRADVDAWLDRQVVA